MSMGCLKKRRRINFNFLCAEGMDTVQHVIHLFNSSRKLQLPKVKNFKLI